MPNHISLDGLSFSSLQAFYTQSFYTNGADGGPAPADNPPSAAPAPVAEESAAPSVADQPQPQPQPAAPANPAPAEPARPTGTGQAGDKCAKIPGVGSLQIPSSVQIPIMYALGQAAAGSESLMTDCEHNQDPAAQRRRATERDTAQDGSSALPKRHKRARGNKKSDL